MVGSMTVLEQHYLLEEMNSITRIALVLSYLILNEAVNPEIHNSVHAAFTVEARWRRDLCWSTRPSFL
jgi:hypothetical protein